ncbi:hypothetical protein F4801DRAFT_583575 [Xylaria longipes]|nr:hypothetical protein F4801DRAFT_583575 [Xylaria longipes]
MAPPKDLVIIEPGGDTIISVSKKVGKITRRVAFQVSRALVVKLQLSGDVYDGNNYKISLTGSDAASIETIGVLLQCMSEYYRKNIPAERYIFSIDQVWRVLTLVSVKAGQHFLRGRYNVPSSVLRNWFSAWFDRHAKITTQYVYQTLLYPAFAFRDSESFAAVTKWLAYNATDKIQDRNPPINLPHLYETMRLPKEVLDAVNGARDVLRNRISGLLNQYMKQFLYASSPSGIQRWASIIKTLSTPWNACLKRSQ